jgi:YD repeat-containing protein
MKLNYILFIAATCAVVKSHGQESANKQLSELNIVAPNAASLGKYVDFPVSLHTGIPDIAVPLYTVTEGPLSLPISLSYNASGIKVGETAGWTGLGWSLNAGGVITRSVRGLPDEIISPTEHVGYYDDNGYFSYLTRPGTGDLDLDNFGNFRKDGEPDIFFFNFSGISGKFFIREDNVPVVIPHQEIRIEPIFCTGSECNTGVDKLKAWKITSTDGTRYFFGISGDQPTHGAPAVEKTHPYTERNGQSISKISSSWYLYKIESADKEFSINLKYEQEEYSYYSLSLGGHLYKEYTSLDQDQVLVKNNVQGIRLSEINFAQGKVKFIPQDQPREDFANFQGGLTQGANTQAKALQTLEISAGIDFCKRFTFNYGYFTANSNPLTGWLTGYELTYKLNCDRKRLKLKSVQETSCDGSLTLPPTQFTYEETIKLPSTLSFAMDHWGFYNGKENNRWLIPGLSIDNGATYSTGADREASWPSMTAGILKSISYPTGGFTSFEYGFDEIGIRSNPSAPPKMAAIGGLRINAINKKDRNSLTLLRQSFEYPSGVILFSIPSYIYKIRNRMLRLADVGNNKIVANGCVSREFNGPPYTYVISTSSVHPLRTTLGSHKGYEHVKVWQADGGYSLYTYDVSGAPSTSQGVSNRAINAGECTGFEPEYPPIPENAPLRRGQLLLEQHFAAGQEKPVQEVSYNPQFKEDIRGAHALFVQSLAAPGEQGALFPSVEYQIKSGKKIGDEKIEKYLEPLTNGKQEIKTLTEYKSVYHTFPTSTTILQGFNEKKELRNKYAKDFSPCNPYLDPTYNHLMSREEAVRNTYASNLAKCRDAAQRSSICGSLRGCVADPRNPCSNELACNKCAYTEYQIALSEVRADYVEMLLDSREADCLAKQTPVQDPVYQSMLDLNMINAGNSGVEYTEWQNDKLLKASLIRYSKINGGVFPTATYRLDVSSPLPAAEFKPSGFDINSAIVSDGKYNTIPEASYSYENGKVVEVLGRNGVTTSYIWDATSNFLMAKGEGISLYDLTNAYTSASTAGTPGTAVFNEQIRSLAPAAALITTYTYKNLVGVSSVTDPNNFTTSYEYDSLGRLKLVKDNDGNILKFYDYQFDQRH